MIEETLEHSQGEMYLERRSRTSFCRSALPLHLYDEVCNRWNAHEHLVNLLEMYVEDDDNNDLGHTELAVAARKLLRGLR